MANYLSSKTKALNGPNAEAEQEVKIKERINSIVHEVQMYAEEAHRQGYSVAVLNAILSNPNIQFELEKDASVDDEVLYVKLTVDAPESNNLGTMTIGSNILSYDIRLPHDKQRSVEAILTVPTFPTVDDTTNSRRIFPQRKQEPETQQVVYFGYWNRQHAAIQLISLTENITREEVERHPGIYMMTHHKDKRILFPREQTHASLRNFIDYIATYNPNEEI